VVETSCALNSYPFSTPFGLLGCVAYAKATGTNIYEIAGQSPLQQQLKIIQQVQSQPTKVDTSGGLKKKPGTSRSLKLQKKLEMLLYLLCQSRADICIYTVASLPVKCIYHIIIII
jgi:hypothetical protein